MYFVLDERLLRKNLLPPSCFSNLFLTPECLSEVTSITSFLSGSASPGQRICGWEQGYASDGLCQERAMHYGKFRGTKIHSFYELEEKQFCRGFKPFVQVARALDIYKQISQPFTLKEGSWSHQKC